jgi:hypothetical protein
MGVSRLRRVRLVPGEHGHSELAMEKLARLVGTSSTVLRKTYVHLSFTLDDWDDLRSFGSPPGPGQGPVTPPTPCAGDRQRRSRVAAAHDER